MNRKIIEKTAIECFEEWLDSYLNFERTPKKGIFWLDTIKFLCERFDNPQDSFNSVHIAGSKGKGSVSTMLSSIIKEYKGACGLYTSPHILNLAERITNSHFFLDEKVYEESLKELVYKTESIIPDNLPNEREFTWFELVTVFAFLCFRRAKMDWTVFETGLGGRLDSTNILKPKLSVIMPIELEHTEFLGDTIEKIAFEKAGIIKSGVPVCISKQYDVAFEVIKKQAEKVGADIFCIEDYVSNLNYELPKINKKNNKKTMKVDIRFNNFFKRPIHAELNLVGKVQAENASIACLCAKLLFPEITEETIESGLQKAFLPGRFEIIENPLNPKTKVIFDGAHTVNSIKGTIDSFKTIFEDTEKANLLFSAAADKDISHIATDLINCNLFSEIYLTKPGSVKQCDLSTIEKAFYGKSNYQIDEDFSKIINKALSDSSKIQKNLLITGSFYLIAEAKKVVLAISSKTDSEIL